MSYARFCHLLIIGCKVVLIDFLAIFAPYLYRALIRRQGAPY